MYWETKVTDYLDHVVRATNSWRRRIDLAEFIREFTRGFRGTRPPDFVDGMRGCGSSR